MNIRKLAAIFDMDGVVVNNANFHCMAWDLFCSEHGMKVSKEEVKSWFGNTNKTILQHLFNNSLMSEDIKKMAYRKEEIYREIYSSEITPVIGLIGFLKELKMNNISIALATAAPIENVDFVLKMTKTVEFFNTIIEESQIKLGKPSPEIFLKAALAINADPSSCVVFEDSFHGIMAGNSAGMKVVGVATSHKQNELKDTILNIRNFTDINYEKFSRLIIC
jgi:beta-phosphoglucomutase